MFALLHAIDAGPDGQMFYSDHDKTERGIVYVTVIKDQPNPAGSEWLTFLNAIFAQANGELSGRPHLTPNVRSMSVGDVVVFDDEPDSVWFTSMVGFRRLTGYAARSLADAARRGAYVAVSARSLQEGA